MARPLRIHVPGLLYHVTSRGNAKQTIFLDDDDCRRFLVLLARAAIRFRVDCLSFCLQGNHFHLLLRPHEFTISRMMQYLNSTYAQSFNRRHGRVGHVFQGRFSARLVDTGTYFLNALRYIALNPVVARCVCHPADWPWSSYRMTTGQTPRPAFLQVDDIWAAFGTSDEETGRQRFIEFVTASSPESAPSELAFLAGSDAFVRRLRPLLHGHQSNDAYVCAEKYAARLPLEQIMTDTRPGTALYLAMRQAFYDHAYTLREIGEAIGRRPATVWTWIRRVRHSCEGDADLSVALDFSSGASAAGP